MIHVIYDIHDIYDIYDFYDIYDSVSVFSWFPFIGAYLRSFAGYFFMLLNPFLSINIDWDES